MKYFLGLFLSLSLVACGGGGSSNPKSSLGFSQEELANTILVSKSLLNIDINREIPAGVVETEGSIDVFNADGILREFPLTRKNYSYPFTDAHVKYVDSPYTVLSDGQIQIDYAGLGICTTKKERETDTEIDVSGKCPNLSNLFDTVLKPLEFDVSFLQGMQITIQGEGGTTQVFNFTDNGTFEETNSRYSAGLTSGTFLDSKYKNVVRLNLPKNIGLSKGPMVERDYLYDYSLLILVAGSLSNGKIVEIRYFAGEIIEDVRIHDIYSTGAWSTSNIYTNWSLRGR